MTKLISFAVLVLFVLPSHCLQANGSGNVQIKVNGGNIFYLGLRNILEINISNDAELTAMSIGFEISSTCPFAWVANYGDRPTTGCGSYCRVLKTEPNAVGAFNLTGGVIVDVRFDDVSPDTFLLTGSGSSGGGLPPSASPRLCYDLLVDLGCGVDDDTFWVDNVFVPPSGTWSFTDSSPYPPTFQGQPNSDVNNPDAPPLTFLIRECPCAYPEWTAVPPITVNRDHCQSYQFHFQAYDPNDPPTPLVFSSSVGEINPVTGEFTLSAPSGGSCQSQAITASVINEFCFSVNYTFTVNWTNDTPSFVNCPIYTAKTPVGSPYTYALIVTEGDSCDELAYSAVAVGTPPVGSYGISQSGTFTYMPDVQDDGNSYSFRISVADPCGIVDSCLVGASVEPQICGDCNGNDIVNVADVVYLLGYIFSGGLPPNPVLIGDVNCNGLVNIADVVYLISYIFSGGPPPCPVC